MKQLLQPALGAAFALLLAGAAQAAPELPPQEAGKPIDVVLCLDTSNSMDGLIGSAKTKLWDIVNDLAKIKPAPNLRVALYSYGNDNYDRNAGWVRKDADLTTDLDMISQKLFALTTRGGTEYVTRVCKDALLEQKWSEDKNALRLIFVAGNEPADQDKVVSLKEAADLSKEKGVTVTPIYCVRPNESDASWQEYARLCGTKCLRISQEAGTVVISTPMDKELAELSGKLNTTYLAYGKDADKKLANQKAQDENARKLGDGAAASRAEAKGGGLYRNSEWDLVDRLKNDPKFDVKKVPEEELCDELKKMKPEEREAYVKKKLEEREAIQKQIGELSAKRAAYIKDEQKKNPSKADKAFDDAIRAALREQAEKKGIKIPD